MAFAAATRRNLAFRGLSNLLERRFHPSIPQLLPSSSTGDPRQPSPLPPKPAPRSFHFGIAHFGTSQTLNFLPFGSHLLPGPLRRSFSSSSRDPDFTNVLTDATHAAAAPASFPGEVARAAEDSSMAVAAVQHLIDAVHSFTGLNWWISIALSTVLLRCVLSTLWIFFRKRLYMTSHDLQQIGKLVKNAQDDASKEEAANTGFRIIKSFGLLTLPPIVTSYTIITLYTSISNMVDKVPSLNGGGAFWFTDLTTPDALCIFPMITSLFIMLRIELFLFFYAPILPSFFEMGREAPAFASIGAHSLIYCSCSKQYSKYYNPGSERVETCINHLKMRSDIKLSNLESTSVTPPSSQEIEAMCNHKQLVASSIHRLPVICWEKVDNRALRRCKGCTRRIGKIKMVWRAISLLSMLWTTTLPQAISCSFVAWSSVSLAERRAFNKPAVQTVLFGVPVKARLRCSSCSELNGLTANDSPSPVKEHDTDKKSTKGG